MLPSQYFATDAFHLSPFVSYSQCSFFCIIILVSTGFELFAIIPIYLQEKLSIRRLGNVLLLDNLPVGFIF